MSNRNIRLWHLADMPEVVDAQQTLQTTYLTLRSEWSIDTRHVCYWHKADILRGLNVCFGGKADVALRSAHWEVSDAALLFSSHRRQTSSE
jgi:hypothetical protein